MARRAGTQQAATATSVSEMATTPNVKRVGASDAPRPTGGLATAGRSKPRPLQSSAKATDASFVAQGDYWVYAHGSAGRDVASG
jgi:hypothetical protein